MAAPRRVIEVSFSEKELSDLAWVSRSRTEPANHVQRACILLTYREKPSLKRFATPTLLSHIISSR
jgi:hypothetical protein